MSTINLSHASRTPTAPEFHRNPAECTGSDIGVVDYAPEKVSERQSSLHSLALRREATLMLEDRSGNLLAAARRKWQRRRRRDRTRNPMKRPGMMILSGCSWTISFSR